MQLRRLVVPALIPAAFFAGTFVNIGFAKSQQPQQPQAPPSVFVVDYMKVPRGGDAALVAHERNPWKAIHQERVRQGLGRSWALYQVRWPAGTTRAYDYVTVNTFNSVADIDRAYPDEFFKKAVPNMPLEELIRRAEAVREIVRTEVWYAMERVP